MNEEKVCAIAIAQSMLNNKYSEETISAMCEHRNINYDEVINIYKKLYQRQLDQKVN